MIAPLSLIEYVRYQQTHFTCSAGIDIYSGNVIYVVNMSYEFNGYNGILRSLGDYKDGNQKDVRIARNFTFHTEQDGKDTVLFSQEGIQDEGQAKLLSTIIPDFYLYKDRGLTLRLYRQGRHGYVFTLDSLPLFYCRNDG
ncbi:TPA: hypothetical protein U2R15_004156 [Klebsiella aerogenes]|nr:hypothetical protein [Klebsiella aerogenes]